MSLRRTQTLLTLTLLTMCGCTTSRRLDELSLLLLKQSEAQERTNQQLVARLERMEQDLRQVWGSMYCKEEVRNFLRQCEANARAGAGPENCSEKKMKDVLTFMTTQRHVVIYLKPDQELKQVPDWRKGMLRELLDHKLLTTRFLVLAHTDPNGSAAGNTSVERRTKQVVDLMLQTYKVPADRLLGPWLSPYRITGREIDSHLSRDDDRPKRGEPANLELGIWVFRVDC